jgi:hypothetical protein
MFNQWLRPVILATQEAETRRIVVQSHPHINTKKGWPVAVMVEHLPSKHKSLSSNPSTAIKKKKKKKVKLLILVVSFQSPGQASYI